MAVSKAHIKASNKYNKENYSKIQANINKEDYILIDNFCKARGISKAGFIVTACKEYIKKYENENKESKESVPELKTNDEDVKE